MGLEDKVNNTAEKLQGKAKEAVGQVTGNDKLENEGKSDQLGAQIKEGYEDVKDALADGADKVKGFVSHLADKIEDAVDDLTGDNKSAGDKVEEAVDKVTPNTK